MEAESVEDHGEGIMFNVYCYNNQPGVDIDYATGESQAAIGRIGECMVHGFRKCLGNCHTDRYKTGQRT